MSWTINEQSKTSETQYFDASYTTGLSLLVNALLSSITQQTVGATANTYGPVVSTSSGAGTGATFNVTVGAGGTVTSITVAVAGSGYAIGDTITIANGLIGGGTPPTDLIITLTANNFGTDGEGGIIVPSGSPLANSAQINVAGYTTGTISFSISPAPNAAWAGGSFVEISIIGSISTNDFVVIPILTIDAGDTNSTFYIEWALPLEKVALRIDNNISVPLTGQTITISGIRLITESNGGGEGYVTSSGISIAPGGVDTDVQYNKGGLFGGEPALTYTYNAAGTEIAPKTFTVGSDGIIGGIQRYCSVDVDNSWEDGNCGNSDFILFLPGDFTWTNPPGNSSNDYRIADSGAAPRVITGQTSAAINTLGATKLIPNGFGIPDERGSVIVYSDATGGFGSGVSTIIVNTTQINSAAVPVGVTLNSSILTFANFQAPVNTTVSATSDGLLSVGIKITTAATGLANNAGLVGVRVKIERR